MLEMMTQKVPNQSHVSLSSSRSISITDEGQRLFFERYSFHELCTTVETDEKTLHHLQLENTLFMDYLMENDPQLLTEDTPKSRRVTRAAMEDQFQARPSRLFFATKRESVGKHVGVNLLQKTKMIVEAIDKATLNLKEMRKKNIRACNNLRAELKEFEERKREIEKVSKAFEQNVVIEGVESITQKIPAEKFIKFLQEWSRNAQLIIQNLRLGITTATAKYRQLSLQLVRRINLGENLQMVDIEKLQIENRHYADVIEKKNSDLLHMKYLTGRSSLTLTNNKNIMQKKTEEIDRIKELIKIRQRKINYLRRECEVANRDIQIAQSKYSAFKQRKETYSVPDVMEYINVKIELNELEKNIKRRQRRKNIQDISIDACINEMRHLTGAKTVQPSWFVYNEEEPCSDDDDFTINFI